MTGVIADFRVLAVQPVCPPSLWIPSPTLLGALTGAASLIPVVGMKIVYIPVTVLLAVEAALTDPSPSGSRSPTRVSLVVVDTIPDFLIRPYVSGDLTHVGLLMFAYILGPIAFGFYGIFLGPMLLVLAAQFFRIIVPYIITGTVETTQTSLSEYDSGES